jgi:hypothetical protein
MEIYNTKYSNNIRYKVPTKEEIVTQDCAVCFDSVITYLTCSNKNCHTVICEPCANQYLNLSVAEKALPKCPNPTCDQYYLITNIKKFPDLIPIYNDCCLVQLITQDGDQARKDLEVMNRLETLRHTRSVFIAEKFPLAIAYTAISIMEEKLKKLDKQLTEKIQQQSLSSTRRCMNITCKGSLDKDLNCLTCGCSFCQNCEQRKEKNHVCDSDDIESVNVIKAMIKCPNCFLPILKSQGCDNMTCSHCGQRFTYHNGEKGGGGGHGNVAIQLRKTLTLSSEYNKKLSEENLLEHILQIELLAPKLFNPNKINNLLIKYYSQNQHLNESDKNILSHAFEKYVLHQKYKRKYNSSLAEIEMKLRENRLTLDYLVSVIDMLQNT